MAVGLVIIGGLVGNLPISAAIEALDNSDGDGLGLLVGQLDLEAFVKSMAAIIDVKVSLGTGAFHVEGVAGGDFH